ncbi:MAG: hypothetical protein JRC87_00225 [Deltaproteobacteria bacterium]|nr:hypothetical protein [Deltaproteobacteria bacterium]
MSEKLTPGPGLYDHNGSFFSAGKTDTDYIWSYYDNFSDELNRLSLRLYAYPSQIVVARKIKG